MRFRVGLRFTYPGTLAFTGCSLPHECVGLCPASKFSERTEATCHKTPVEHLQHIWHVVATGPHTRTQEHMYLPAHVVKTYELFRSHVHAQNHTSAMWNTHRGNDLSAKVLANVLVQHPISPDNMPESNYTCACTYALHACSHTSRFECFPHTGTIIHTLSNKHVFTHLLGFRASVNNLVLRPTRGDPYSPHPPWEGGRSYRCDRDLLTARICFRLRVFSCVCECVCVGKQL